MKINQILQNYNLGVLPDVTNSYGITDKGIRVWLPQINVNPYWKNVLLANDEIIVQKGLTGNPQQKQPTIWDPAVVILRDKPKNPHRKLADKYRPVYSDLNISLTIHAKETLPIAQGNVTTVGNTSWITGFASTLQDAQKKADSYKKEAGV